MEINYLYCLLNNYTLNIHQKINLNSKESVFIIVFKNRRFEQFGGWKHDGVQVHSVKKDRLKGVIEKLQEQGFYEA